MRWVGGGDEVGRCGGGAKEKEVGRWWWSAIGREGRWGRGGGETERGKG